MVYNLYPAKESNLRYVPTGLLYKNILDMQIIKQNTNFCVG